MLWNTFFAISGLQNGSPEWICISNPLNGVVQFLKLVKEVFTAVGSFAEWIN